MKKCECINTDHNRSAPRGVVPGGGGVLKRCPRKAVVTCTKCRSFYCAYCAALHHHHKGTFRIIAKLEDETGLPGRRADDGDSVQG